MIYLDNAATSYPKPPSVLREAARAVRYAGGNPGRSGHRLARAASQTVYAAREAIAALFDGLPENVVFTLNATYALNLAIDALAPPGSHIVISNVEHNAVLRPVASRKGGHYSLFDARGNDDAIVRSCMAAITPQTSLVICTHVSNLCGLTLPIARIGRLCRERGIAFAVDVSQSAGHRPVSLRECGADALCAPGHKGLLGLMGSGFVLFADRYREDGRMLLPFVHGGNGVDSREATMPPFLPERFEAGTLPLPAIASLGEGIRELGRIGQANVITIEETLGKRLRKHLSEMPGITVYGGAYGGGTVLFNLDGVPSETVAECLDGLSVCVRSGLHCCPLGHETLGTGIDGAVRASVSVFTVRQEIDTFAEHLLRIRKQYAVP